MRSRALAFSLLLVLEVPAAVKLGTVRQIGGSNIDSVSSLTRDSAGNLYIAGKTYSVDFPANVNQTRPGGSNLTRIEGGGARITPLAGHGGAAVLAISAEPGRLLVLTSNGLLKSSDAGDTFTPCDPMLPGGSIFGGIAVDGGNVYVALSSYGVFKSTDGCATFAPSNSGIGSISTNIGTIYPEQVFVNPYNPSTLFAGSHITGPGFYRSDDAGSTWQRQNLDLRNLIFDRAHPGLVYALGYVSTDGGRTWTPNAPNSTFGFGGGGGSLMPQALDSQGNLFAVDVSTVYYSPDRGKTWTPMHTFGLTTLVAADPDSATVYVLSGQTLYSSTDHFATWQTAESSQVAGIAAVAVSRGTIFAAGVRQTSDGFAAKLDPTGKLIWATYLGGGYDDAATGIAVAPNGDVFVCGSTQNALDAGSFVTRLSGDGTLIYMNHFTDSLTAAQAIAVDAAGNTYVTGTTTGGIGGLFGTLPVTPGAAQQTLLPPSSGSAPEPRLPNIAFRDAFACKIGGDGKIVYCTYLGNGSNTGTSISIDAAGDAYIAGGDTIWKLNPAGSAVVYTQRLTGGSILAGALDGRGSWFVGGTVSVPIFPTTAGAFQRTLNVRPGIASGDAFVTRLDAATGSIVASTFIGGESNDIITALVPAPDGTVTAAGMTTSRTFPLRAAFQSSFADATAFVARLSGDLSTLVFSTYAGDSRRFAAFGVALADDGSVWVGGDTAYPWANGPFGGGAAATADVFVTQLIPEAAAPPDLTAVINSASRVGTAIAPNQIITVIAPGAGPDAAVLIDGVALPTISSGAGVIVAQVPADFQPPNAVNLTVQTQGEVSSPLLMPGAIAAPAIYTQDGSGAGLGLIFNDDGSLNAKDNPAAQGSVVSIACNGIGSDSPVNVYVNGGLTQFVDATTQALPGLPGAALILRVRIPLPDPNSPPPLALVSVVLNVGGDTNFSGIQSPDGVAIAVK
jgi:hypothetical protein